MWGIIGFCTTRQHSDWRLVEKYLGFTTFCERLFPVFFHCFFASFFSVNANFLPTFNMVYNDKY